MESPEQRKVQVPSSPSNGDHMQVITRPAKYIEYSVDCILCILEKLVFNRQTQGEDDTKSRQIYTIKLAKQIKAKTKDTKKIMGSTEGPVNNRPALLTKRNSPRKWSNDY